MQVQVNTDKNVKGSENFEQYVRSTVEAALGRFEPLTRVEVHVGDENGAKTVGDDKRCLVEARPAGMQPVVVTHLAATNDEAVEGAVEKMAKVLTKTFDRLHAVKGSGSLGETSAAAVEATGE